MSRFDDCMSTRTGGATVVGGAGVAMGTKVPSCKQQREREREREVREDER